MTFGLTGGNRFIGVQWRHGCPEECRQRFLNGLPQNTSGWWSEDSDLRSIRCEATGFRYSNDAGTVCLGSPQVVDVALAKPHWPKDVLANLGKNGVGSCLNYSAPFSVMWSNDKNCSLEAVTDQFGIGQVFFINSKSFTAVSNSSSLLARVFNCPLDHRALIGFSMFGAFQEDDSAFSNIKKLMAGHSLTASSSSCQLTFTSPFSRSSTRAGVPSIKSLADCLRGKVRGLSEAFPNADLQLSGGLDSRLILAAIPADKRPNHAILSIGSGKSPDVTIATQITSARQLKHRIIDVGDLDELNTDKFDELLHQAVHGFDCAANPLDKVSLLLAEKMIDCDAWFNGQNGEIMRGFYYYGQDLNAKPTEVLVQSLLRWRLESNDKVDARIFDARVYSEYASSMRGRVIKRLLSLDESWAKTLDLYYLLERMQRWAGNSIDNLTNSKTYLCPFFDVEFVNAALGMAPQLKAHSRGAHQLLFALDPNLAAMPLDTGIRPSDTVNAPLRAALSENMTFVKKLSTKVTRQFLGRKATTLGSSAVSELWHSRQLFNRLPQQELLQTGLFNPAAIEAICSGNWVPARPTLGFILMVAGIVERK